MAEQAKKGGKPAAAPDKGEVSDAELEKVSGGTGSSGSPASGRTIDDYRDSGPNPRPV